MKKILFICLMAFHVLSSYSQTRIIAHRGFWNCDGSAQNSITALKKASQIPVYGSEFDVLMTSDGTLVVNHDDVIGSDTINLTPYARIKETKLNNGETLPLLSDYLQAGKQLPETQLILEIKPHLTKELEDRAVAALSSISRKRMPSQNPAAAGTNEKGLEKQVEYISFSMNICEQLVKLSPTSEIAYLKSDIAPSVIREKGLTGIDYYYKVFDKHPEWVEEAHKVGLKVNVWTVNETPDLQKMLDLKVDFITTDHPVEAKELASK